MDFEKMVKEDLKNFNGMIAELKQLQKELILYTGQEDKFKNELKQLNYKIVKFSTMIDLIKVTISLLDPLEQKILICNYFEKMTLPNIAYLLNISKEKVTLWKKNAIEKLSILMYGGFENFEVNFFNRIRVTPVKKTIRNNPIYQYSTDGIFIHKWDNVKQCAKENNYNICSLHNACSGRVKTFKGYKWSYVIL